MKSTGTIYWNHNWYRSLKDMKGGGRFCYNGPTPLAYSTMDQDRFMMGRGGKGKYRVEHVPGDKKPGGKGPWYRLASLKSSWDSEDMTGLTVGREEISLCRSRLYALLGTSARGWLRVTKVRKSR